MKLKRGNQKITKAENERKFSYDIVIRYFKTIIREKRDPDGRVVGEYGLAKQNARKEKSKVYLFCKKTTKKVDMDKLKSEKR